MILDIILFLVGMGLLYYGGEIFIKGSTSAALLFGLRPFTIAATVAAFATSAPELFVSFAAVLRGSQKLAMGNILGSCITNIALVLGICALIRPIKIEMSLLRKEVPMLIAAAILVFFCSIDLRISRFEASILLLGFCMFVFYCIKTSKNEKTGSTELPAYSKGRSYLFLGLGMILLLLGSQLLVKSALSLADLFGISQIVIGLTVVALGTSLPELSISAAAALKGKHETSIGNIIGSNIFNLLLIIGVVCIVQPISIPLEALKFEIPLMLIYSIMLLPLLRTGFVLSRREGLALLSTYSVYIFILFKRG